MRIDLSQPQHSKLGFQLEHLMFFISLIDNYHEKYHIRIADGGMSVFIINNKNDNHEDLIASLDLYIDTITDTDRFDRVILKRWVLESIEVGNSVKDLVEQLND